VPILDDRVIEKVKGKVLETRIKFRTSDPWVIAQRTGVEVVESPGGVFGNMIKFADYDAVKKRITLYTGIPPDVKAPSMEERIAHELFHHLYPSESSEEAASVFKEELLRK
jgi:hypothetical protein